MALLCRPEEKPLLDNPYTSSPNLPENNRKKCTG